MFEVGAVGFGAFGVQVYEVLDGDGVGVLYWIVWVGGVADLFGDLGQPRWVV